MSAYYNELDPFAAQWLRNLISAGLIAPGDVDERDIRDVRPGDLAGYAQCHFFAGMGGWSYALRLAGWDDSRPVWTGSCPCQPFSSAGTGKAGDDERHLWPSWASLIAECKPPVVFGEQVEAAIGWGWLDLVLADLEAAEGYACGAAVLPACGVGAPHIRQRLWFVADANLDGGTGHVYKSPSERGEDERTYTRDGGHVVGLADAMHAERRASWRDLEWLLCRDGKARPTKPGLFPLAHGVPARVGKLRAAGNAIVPQVAAEFIAAFVEARAAA